MFYYFIVKRSKGRDELQSISLAAVGIATGLSNFLALSPC